MPGNKYHHQRNHQSRERKKTTTTTNSDNNKEPNKHNKTTILKSSSSSTTTTNMMREFLRIRRQLSKVKVILGMLVVLLLLCSALLGENRRVKYYLSKQEQLLNPQQKIQQQQEQIIQPQQRQQQIIQQSKPQPQQVVSDPPKKSSTQNNNVQHNNHTTSVVPSLPKENNQNDNNINIVESSNDKYAKKMQELGLVYSARHQSKFQQQRQFFLQTFQAHRLYRAWTGNDQIFTLSDSSPLAYVHVWKSGGTTMKRISAQKYRLADKAVQNHTWMTFVRDPIEHFLSGWAECGERRYRWSHSKNAHKWSANGPVTLVWNESEYDSRIATWLDLIQITANKTVASPGMTCDSHSFPQANFILDQDGGVYQNLRFVADLREMKELLSSEEIMKGFQLEDGKLQPQRISSTNNVKKTHFPYRVDLLSNTTLLGICDFLAVDYFLFDFDPPPVCQGVIPTAANNIVQ